jgi:hypothetical protein
MMAGVGSPIEYEIMKLCAFKRNSSKVTVYRKGVSANQRDDIFFNIQN